MCILILYDLKILFIFILGQKIWFGITYFDISKSFNDLTYNRETNNNSKRDYHNYANYDNYVLHLSTGFNSTLC